MGGRRDSGGGGPPSPAAIREVAADLIGQTPCFLAAFAMVPRLANCDARVLITGETGTGKEMFARAIHALSRRQSRPFLAVNCGAIPLDLMENELFGHERSAYTGAHTSQIGVVQEASGGTLFLDEVDSLSLAAQVKLLRFLQEGEFRPLGSPTPRRADVRVIAATNGSPEQAVTAGRMRSDLFYRLNVFPLRLPPLRDRLDDIVPLAQHFLCRYRPRYGGRVIGLTDRACEELRSWHWPGNVRELEHVIERALVCVGEEDVIQPHHLMLHATPHSPPPSMTFQEAKAQVVDDFEREYLQGVLSRCQGNITRAAVVAGKNRRAFFELLRKHHIDANVYRPVSPGVPTEPPPLRAGPRVQLGRASSA